MSYEIGEKVIIVDERRHFYGYPGEIVNSLGEDLWSVHVTVPPDQQRPSKDDPDYVLRAFTGAFHHSELTSLKDS